MGLLRCAYQHRDAQEITYSMSAVGDMITGLIRKPRIEREAALAVDIILSMTLATFPGVFGKVASVAYFLLRDSWGGGMGKGLYGLVIVRAADGARVGWRTALVRNMLMLLPIYDLVDIYYFVERGRRLTDEWLGTEVRKTVVESNKEGRNGDKVDEEVDEGAEG